VPSVDPLSTRITSVESESENSNPSRLASNLCTLAARLNVGTMTVIQGRSFVLKILQPTEYQRSSTDSNNGAITSSQKRSFDG
jgi:hypothetical protein